MGMIRGFLNYIYISIANVDHINYLKSESDIVTRKKNIKESDKVRFRVERHKNGCQVGKK